MQEQYHRESVFKYRPDIDGLRAVAVLDVIAFHLSPARMPGGFVGVDVFFVISGYLISAIVFSEIAASRFSVLAFYDRRIRRILPALFGMLLVVSAVISWVLLPGEFIDYAKSVIAAATSSSNFYFWHHSGYFDAPTSKPLLHTWSLAVEEQFYIFFPLFLALARRLFPRRLESAVLVFFFASLVTSQITVQQSAIAGFYLPHTRAWELLLGTLISVGYFPRLQTKLTRNAVALLGIAMIGCASLFFSAQTPFPGVAAILPCAGAAMVIGAGESGSSLTGAVLSWRPMVFVGLISYSLYLWHWPVIVLNDLGLPLNVSASASGWASLMLSSQAARKTGEILVSFALAVLSWRFVERPFRAKPRRIERRAMVLLSATVMSVLIATSAAVVYQNGFPGRFPPRALRVASFLTPPGATSLGQLGRCIITDDNRVAIFSDSSCLKTSHKETYLLIGDSHAGALWEGLQTSLPGADVLLAAVWGCRPSLHSDEGALCKQMMDFLTHSYLPSHHVQALVLEARWYPKSLPEIAEVSKWAKSMGLRVIVFGPVAEYDAPLPRLLAYSVAWNKPRLPGTHLLSYSPRMDEEMQRLAQSAWNVDYISLYQAECTRDLCLEYADPATATPLLSDTDHLSQEGSRLLVSRLVRFGKLGCMLQPRVTAVSAEPRTAVPPNPKPEALSWSSNLSRQSVRLGHALDAARFSAPLPQGWLEEQARLMCQW